MKSKKIDKKNIVFVLFIILIISLIVFRRYIYEPYYLFNNRMLSDIVRANVPTYYHMFDAIEKGDRKSTRLNSSHKHRSRMPSSA